MLYLCVLLLGVVSGFVLSAAGLILLSSVLFVSLGVAGAIHHEPLFAVLLKAASVSTTLQLAYAAPLICTLVGSLASGRALRKIRNPATTTDSALADNVRANDDVDRPAPPTTAMAHIRTMITRIADRRPPSIIDGTPGRVQRVARTSVPLA